MWTHLTWSFAAMLLTAGTALAAGTGSDAASPDPAAYEEAVALVEDADYEGALAILENLDRDGADVLNMLGYAYRKLGRIEEAFDHYRRALAIEPLHPGANEYLGELHVETGDIAAAEERLAVLEAACPEGCEERDELAGMIAAYRQAADP